MLPSIGLVITACCLDRLIGDPRWCLHPVQVMGAVIQQLRAGVETISGDRPWALRLGGGLITIVVVGGSALAGWVLEQFGLRSPWGLPFLVIALASTLAARSLRSAVDDVLKPLSDSPPELELARKKLGWIVGRNVDGLLAPELLRATAETASENAVDGLFAPLFWMLVGAGLWSVGLTSAPGPLALAWSFKAASTLDSMLGYRKGRLRWLGTAGARLDDLMTWLPCRIVMLSLPLVSRPWRLWPELVRAAEDEGGQDPSPNAGRSQSIYAHCAGVRLGGRNRYGNRWVEKPLLGAEFPVADVVSVKRIMGLTERLELLWLLIAAGFCWAS